MFSFLEITLVRDLRKNKYANLWLNYLFDRFVYPMRFKPEKGLIALATGLHSLLTKTTQQSTKRQLSLWFALSLASTAICMIQTVSELREHLCIIQDDARQFVPWMERFADSGLFPQDLIADYFQAVTPIGLKAVYGLGIYLGLPAIFISQLLPPILGAIAAIYCFGVSLEIFPVPAAACLSTILFSQGLWLEDDLSSATARAFIYPCFLAFLFYLQKNASKACLLTILVTTLFYPQVSLIFLGVLTLRLVYQPKGLRFSHNRTDYWLWAIAVVLAGVIAIGFQQASGEFGPVVTPEYARHQAEFLQIRGDMGRNFFFHDNPLMFWFANARSGIFFGLLPPLVITAFYFPLCRRRPTQFLQQVTPKITLLNQVLLVSFGLFFLAHLLLFHLYLPNRYVYHSLRIVLPLFAGIVLFVWFEAGLRSVIQATSNRQRAIALLKTSSLTFLIFFSIHLFFGTGYTVANQAYIKGKEYALYDFLKQQPKDILIASFATDANNIPTFAHRSVLYSKEYALAYHTGYYQQIRQRLEDIVAAQYSPQISDVKRVVEKYGIDFWLLRRQAFELSYIQDTTEIRLLELDTVIPQQIQTGAQPLMAQKTDQCQILSSDRLILLDAHCLLQPNGEEALSL